jgi:hypothetical protein
VPSLALRLQGLDRPDYQDAFGIEANAILGRPALSWGRALFEEQPVFLTALLLLVAWLLRLRPGPLGSQEHVLGLRILASAPGSLVLGAGGPAVDLRLVVLAPSDSQPLTLGTFLQFHNRRMRPLVRLLLVGHRRAVPVLLERALARSSLSE